ncbi:DNA recombination protein RmuC [Propioniciclava soli]|uniref:DNA recombination protein RmuC n=1 Tax=Propioniciclava soli TaxID=2775081 RepID=UPI001E38BFB9|nr:DNA recombination protein RmuC [Propioniciclava soli]
MENVGILLVALLVGVALGGLGAWLVLRRSAAVEVVEDAAAADRLRAAEASARAEAERARAEHAGAELRVREAQADAERARRGIAEERTAAAEARSEAAAALAQVASLEARRTSAVAERDTALARAAEIAADRDALVKEFKVLSGQALDEQGRKVDASAEARLRQTEMLMAPIKESLAKFDARLGEVEQARVTMATELAQQVRAVQFTGEQLRKETHALSTALRKPHVRGAWGELQLKRVAEVAGMVEYCDFVQQSTTTTSEDRVIRPDLKVTLAEGKFVYVDAKVPLSAFLDAQETEDERDREHHLAQFARNVRSHVDALGGKNYWKADPGTPEFVVMFVPNEALGFEAMRLIPDLQEYASARNIVVATPSTLIALLRAVAYGWKQAKLAESAAEVSQLGRELYDRLGTMGGNVDRLGRALGSAVKAYNATVGSLETRVLVTARRFRDLNVTDAELAPLGTVEEPLRQVAAPELVADAAGVPTLVGRVVADDAPADASAPRLPEQDELLRPEPGLEEVVDATHPLPARPARKRA